MSPSKNTVHVFASRSISQIIGTTKRASSFKGVDSSDRLWDLHAIVKGLRQQQICVVAEACTHFLIRGLAFQYGGSFGGEQGEANEETLVAAAVAAGMLPLLLNIVATLPGCAGLWAITLLSEFDHHRAELLAADGFGVLTRALQFAMDRPLMLELPEVVESTFGVCRLIYRLANITPERCVPAGPAFVEAGAVPPIVALLLCPAGSGLLSPLGPEGGAPHELLPSTDPALALLALLRNGAGAAEAAFAAGAIPKLVALWGLDLKYGVANSQGRIREISLVVHCLEALSARFGAEVAAAKAEAGLVDPPPPPPPLPRRARINIDDIQI